MLEALEPLLLHSAAPISSVIVSSRGGWYQLPAVSTSAAAAPARRLPAEWGAHVAAAREEIAWTLQTLNPNALELKRLWHDAGYAAARLVDLESEEFQGRLPAQAEAFRAYQTSITEQLKAQLWTHWLPKCTDVFRRTPPVPINGDAAAYFRAVAVLQGNQLRQLVATSLEDCLAFFRKHTQRSERGGEAGTAPAAGASALAGVLHGVDSVPLDTHGTVAMWSVPAVFETELVVESGAAAFRPSLAASEAAVMAVLDTSVVAVMGMPRIGRSNLAGSALLAPAPAPGVASAVAAMGVHSSSAHIPVAGLEDSDVQAVRKEISAILSENAEAPQKLASLFDRFVPLLALDPQQHAQRTLAACGGAIVVSHAPPPVAANTPAPQASSSGAQAPAPSSGASGPAGCRPDLAAYGEEVERLLAEAAAVWETCGDDIRTGLYVVRTSRFKAQLASAVEGAASALLELLRTQVRDANDAVVREYMTMASEMARPATSGEEALALKKYIGRCGLENERLKEVIAANKAREQFLYRFRHPIPEDDFDAARRAYEWPRRAGDLLRDAMARATAEHRSFEAALKSRRKAFSDLLDRCSAELAGVESRGDIIKREATAAEVDALAARLAGVEKEAEEINAQEKMFGWQVTKYSHVSRLMSTLDPYVQLWSVINGIYNKLASWTNGPFWTLDAEQVEGDATEAYRRLFKLAKTFGGSGGADPKPVPLAVVEEARAKVQAFQAHVPLLAAICNPGIRDRHWEAIAEVAGFEIKKDEVTTLKRLLDNGIGNHLAKLTDIGDAASREAGIERALDKMAADWTGLSFELGPWRDTGTYILKGAPIEEAQMLLDDHVVKSQAMSSSPASRPFADRIGPWEAKLRRFQDILEEWLRCQGKWLYLQPIFGAEEIMRHIPREGGAFRAMAVTWRAIMERVCQAPLMLEVADWPGLLDKLRSCSAQLEVVEKGLTDFLDTKKLAFPRFFFLSNDELLEILAEARDPLAVQPFVKKCFEAVKELVFTPLPGSPRPVITGCVSVEGEKIDFLESIDPVEAGGVECWLLMVEVALKQALHKLTRDALAAYVTTQRHQWILQWPGQTVLAGSQVHWTRHVTDAIQSAGAKGLSAYAARCTQDLNKIVALVRGTLTSLERATCGALVVVDVHARDVVSFMAEEGVEDLHDFRWESQLRYYWESHDEPPSGVKRPADTLVVRMINAEALYGYEYLGNSGRLVITPLTDRCYRTLIGAIHMNLGGAPAGPAGTGKTETTKDLSKALATQCVVFNCSDGLDYKAMGKFFKGLACCGAWACFDEFNRIDLEVLSVVAQQVLTIIRAKAAKARNFLFDGVDIPLVPTCNVFITMNPGYAGRSELPDNLKALFRDVAMMVPDYAMIAEIMLYSYGYLDARALARKLVQTYRLCSEQLSSQDHYDYGMRAVISVLRAAGNLKRAFPSAAEDMLMLRAVRDVNVPKFLDQDVPLFNGILSDLFPGVDPPDVDYIALRKALTESCYRAGLQPLESFLVKAIQLYEMILVRHGLMLVGASFGMKTTAYRMLATALSDMASRGQGGEVPVKLYALNPKAVTMGQLYGQEDAVSKGWTDGVLPVLFRNAARDTSPDRKWLIFDGPVDALWMENMNTVLDDNKKLCLNSGEIIAMQGLMNLIFEVADLAVASPATVSRCGMVYVQPDLLGWRPVFESWIARLPDAIANSEDKEELNQLYSWLLPPCLKLSVKSCFQVLPMHEINLAISCMRLVEALLDDISKSEGPGSAPKKRSALLQCCFLFGLVWSVGANTDGEGRAKFDAALRRIIAAALGQGDLPPDLAAWVTAPWVRLEVPFPEGRSVYDFVLDSSKPRWQTWTDRLEAKPISPDAEYTSIIVPTTDTMRYTYLLDVLARTHQHLLFVGPTGTGKTAYVKRHLATGMSGAAFTSCLLNFSAQTSANTTQDIIDGRLEKRRRGVWGPAGGRHMVVFVDDLNMPQAEEYGAQPPIELLRQWMDHAGWYDRKELSFRHLGGLQFAGAMGPLGGGRTAITGRFLRHFSVISVTAFDRDNLGLIFSALTDWWLKKWGYGHNVTRLAKPLVAATLDVYEQVQAKLLPTPAKSHYSFNLRDVSKVFQGMTKAGSGVEDSSTLVRLWVHEVLRVFYDRLVCDEDRLWIGRLLEQLTEKHLKERLSRVLGISSASTSTSSSSSSSSAPGAAAAGAGGGGGSAASAAAAAGLMSDEDMASGLRGIMFGDFMTTRAESRQYRQLDNPTKLLTAVSDALADMNAGSKRPMQLVLFQFAIEHVCRIARVISQPGGHALLVGLGGSGRQSLTRLAAYISEMEVVQIEISKAYGQEEWHDDLRKLLKKTGEAGKKVVFLFSDTQCHSESWVEDISNMLNTGEVPNLLSSGDMAAMVEAMRPRAKAAGRDPSSKDDMNSFLLDEVRRNLHIVLSFSPVGDTFRERLRRFPSLVNCTTIDWFTAWPRDALHSVATNFLAGLPGIEDSVSRALPGAVVSFHEEVEALAARFYAEQRRRYYVTPTSYLELLGSYKNLLAKRQDEVMAAKRRYEVGLEKLATTEESVSGMQAELTNLQPQLEESSKETAAAMAEITERTAEADKVKVVVQREEAVAAGEAAKVEAIKDECEADLAEALPALEAALRALDTLTKNDITEVKGMKSPPAGVKLVLEAVCILKGVKPIRMKDTNTGQMVDNYWEASKKMLMEEDFLGGLKRYDKDHIEPAVVKKIQVYVSNPEFLPEKIQQASQAAYGLCCWVRAMESYDKVAKVVAPKRAALAEAEGQLAAVMSALATKQAELKKVMDQLDALDRDLQEKTARKEALEAEVELCKVKLDRAHKLIAGLGSEKSRWRDAAAALGRQHVVLTGDVLLAAAQIAYLGPFTQGYRSEALRSWEACCKAAHIPCHSGFKLSTALGDPVKIRQWNICGLPKDDFSTDNAIAIDQGRRWPLAIDPQGLANKWIRALEKPSGLLLVKQSDPGFMRALENAIQFGKPVLLENVGEALDPSLEPLLARVVFKQGGTPCIKLGDAVVEYSDQFKLYITTKLRNPHYAPEVCTKVSLLNFSTTPEGLEDQLLQVLVAAERPDLEDEKNRLILAGAANKRRLKETEDEILRVMSSSSGNILEDEQAVNVLQASKVLADDIKAKQKVADETEAQIDVAREGYQPVAHHASLLYFCCVDLGAIESMYQFSLPWFRSLFSRAIADSGRSIVLAERLQLLNEHFTFFLHQNVCRSLFEKDKLLFALLLSTKVKIDAGTINTTHLRFLLTGGVAVGDDAGPPNPAPDWISPKMWGEVCRAEALGPEWEGLGVHITEHVIEWKEVYDSPMPQTTPLPEPWAARLDAFQRLLLLRVLRPDKLVAGLGGYVAESMGPHFVEPQSFDLAPCYADSGPSTPLIFMLSPGADPMGVLLRFAEERGARVEGVSLGQGQGPVAQRWIEEGAAQGLWVVLQNCHLARSFLPTLEMICEAQLSAEGRVHPNFRLWLTTDPTPAFPVTLLEAGVKITNERPKGLRAGLMRTYTSDPVASADVFEGCPKPGPFKALLFGLAFFHSVCLERRTFGPIGWNIPYEFNDNDLRISIQQLRMFLDEYPDIPFDTLRYTAGECNYGGKVTDAHDRTLLSTLLGSFYTPALLAPGAPLCPGGVYAVPHTGEHKSYVDYIQGLPLLSPPEAFGLGANADIARDLHEGAALLEAVLAAQGRQEVAAPAPAPSAAAGPGPAAAGASGGAAAAQSAEAVIGAMASGVLSRLPLPFDVEAAEAKYPQDYYNSMNTVLVQELVRFNALITVMRSSLAAVVQAVQGLAVMSQELDAVGRSLFDGKVPALWLRRSFPSLKPLGAYVSDVLQRTAFFARWLERGPPPAFWLPGFIFTQAFLTGAKQNYARKHRMPIDIVDFDFAVLDNLQPPQDSSGQQQQQQQQPGGAAASAGGGGGGGVVDGVVRGPDDGVYCYGLFLEGARWDAGAHSLAESEPKVLYSPMPILWLLPRDVAAISDGPLPRYPCPLYKTPERRGVLSTTGHSTNFVTDVRLPSGGEGTPPAHWTRRGAALLASLAE